jgi:tRNA 2-thiouridine synthesizing protein A
MAANPLKLVGTETLPEQQQIHYHHEIDARGLSCPLPMLSTRKSLEHINSGEVLKLMVTDSGAKSYFDSLARQTGLKLLFWQEHQGETHFFLCKP